MSTEQALNYLTKTDLTAEEQLPELESSNSANPERENAKYRNATIRSIIRLRNSINNNASLPYNNYHQVQESYLKELKQKTYKELETLLAINGTEDTFTGKYR